MATDENSEPTPVGVDPDFLRVIPFAFPSSWAGKSANGWAGIADAAVPDVWAALERVQQGELTLQSMVFDPAGLAIHAAFGPGPTTHRPSTCIRLRDLLKSDCRGVFWA